MLTICLLLLLQQATPAGNDAAFAEQHRRGEELIRKNNFRSAVPFLREAYRLNPGDYDNAFDLAQAELQLHDLPAARATARQILARGEHPDVHRLLGECAQAEGNMREAVSEFQTAAHADESEQNLFLFGSSLLQANAPADAERVLLYAVGRYPRSARLQVGLGIAQYAQGNYKPAVETLCRAVDLDPKDARGLEFLGKMAGVAPEYAKEVSARLKHFVTLYPGNAAANYYYAMSLRAATEEVAPQTAEIFLERAVALAPAMTDAHFQLGLLKEQKGDAKAAIDEYRAVVRLDPALRAAHYHLAQLYQKAGRSVEAAREYEVVRKLRTP